MLLHKNLGINTKGNLTIGGRDTVELAEKYGTPLMVLDEDRIRYNVNVYKQAMKAHFGSGSYPLFASKALCFKGIYGIMKQENIGIDIVSSGELFTALSAGFPMQKAFFHGNNKTDKDIAYAIDNGVGYFVADNAEELAAIDAYAGSKGVKQKLLLRLTPGIDPHTHKAICTGNVDSKFGSAIETGQAEIITKYALTLKNISLEGFHCHIGSQLFDLQPFCDASDIMLKYIAYIKAATGYDTRILNLGGGFGVRYTDEQQELDYNEYIYNISLHIKARCAEFGVDMPDVIMEPGRSIVADSGLTLYTVGSVKIIPNYKNYVSVDGGMPDNPRYALYQSPYTIMIANKAAESSDFRCTVAGRCCESGDLLQENVLVPKPKRGDVLAVLVTGAYNYSMASNYNRIPRAPIVMLKGGCDRVAVRRESFEDLIRNEE